MKNKLNLGLLNIDRKRMDNLESLHDSGRVSQSDATAKRSPRTDISINDLHPLLLRLLSRLILVLHVKRLSVSTNLFVIIWP